MFIYKTSIKNLSGEMAKKKSFCFPNSSNLSAILLYKCLLTSVNVREIKLHKLIKF